MEKFKYELHLIAPSYSETKKVDVIWSGNEQMLAWHHFFKFLNMQRIKSLSISETFISAYTLQLLERLGDGVLFVRTSFHYDARPWKENPESENGNAFGWGMEMPKVKKQQLMEAIQDVLLRFVHAWDIGPDDTAFIIDDRYTWMQWLNEFYVPRSKFLK